MKLMEPYSEIIRQGGGISGIEQLIKNANNICNDDKKYELTDKDAVQKISKTDISCLEHGTVYLWLSPTIKPSWLINGVSATDDDFDETEWYFEDNEDPSEIQKTYIDTNDARKFYINNKDSKVKVTGNTQFVTTNYRVLIENKRLRDLQFACEPTQFHEKRMTLRLICDRSTCSELMKHRAFSINNDLNSEFCQFITFVVPNNLEIDELNKRLYTIDLIDYSYNISQEIPLDDKIDYFLYSLQASEHSYFNLCHDTLIYEQAADVLPNATKTNVVITGFESDWKELLESEKDIPEITKLIKPFIK